MKPTKPPTRQAPQAPCTRVSHVADLCSRHRGLSGSHGCLSAPAMSFRFRAHRWHTHCGMLAGARLLGERQRRVEAATRLHALLSIDCKSVDGLSRNQYA